MEINKSVGWLNFYEEYKDCLKCMIIKVKPANKPEKAVAFFFPQKKISYSYCLLLPSLLDVVYLQYACHIAKNSKYCCYYLTAVSPISQMCNGQCIPLFLTFDIKSTQS